MEYHHCSSREIFGDLVQVSEDDGGLIGGAASDQPPDEDYRWIDGL